ncbi:helix-turn-helix domain-containing protein [Bifidobacterium vespertilionis]|uniref:ImmA/IrrE family metallo-endopeptidase n=1 Tax=Bifidobacterium vespertilionis TaxID=2562524 RepID=A0A5J5DV41_9BIFI|nr:XRE family transcriptional regulator [Bifidobacterium vespertilionis]KAA8820735.1 ImmA/IrrE family metallo-endopeptidase [Bifidobacterium vespertilionis]KAA8821818.1 ImmA/IrrE family metallo-endopeptidase [Bifidobacterium vespertilionis]
MSATRATTLPSPFPRADDHRQSLDPERIRCARETAGLSKIQLAELLGVTSRTITNYEEDGAPAFQVNALARALNVMPLFFTVLPNSPAIEDLSEGQVWFRSLRRSTVRQRKSAVGHGRNALLFFRWIEGHFHLPTCDLPVGDETVWKPEEAASALRGDWAYGENPLPDMMGLAEAHGVRLFSLPSVGKEVDAFSFVFADNAYIAVDTAKTPERQRFDIAHEIGHLMLHAGLLSEDVAGRNIESEAHEFAAHLLMPTRRVLAVIPSHATISQIISGKRYFKVSAMAMARRAHELGRLSDWEYRRVCSELTSRGYRTEEPDGIPSELSKVFSFIVQTNQVKGVSTTTISEETGLSSKELHDLSFGSMLYASGKGVTTCRLGATSSRPKLTLHINSNYHGLQ